MPWECPCTYAQSRSTPTTLSSETQARRRSRSLSTPHQHNLLLHHKGYDGSLEGERSQVGVRRRKMETIHVHIAGDSNRLEGIEAIQLLVRENLNA
jgi:hypothetical protein